MSIWQRIEALFGVANETAEVIPDNVYNSCWKNNPDKNKIAGVADEDRGVKVPCVYPK